MRQLILAIGAMLCILATDRGAEAQTRSVTFPANETVALQPVYWVRKINTNICKSELSSVKGIEILSGGDILQLTLRPQQVQSRCENEVNGAMVMITGKDVQVPVTVKLRFVVTYDTIRGEGKSNHTWDVTVMPPGSFVPLSREEVKKLLVDHTWSSSAGIFSFTSTSENSGTFIHKDNVNNTLISQNYYSIKENGTISTEDSEYSIFIDSSKSGIYWYYSHKSERYFMTTLN